MSEQCFEIFARLVKSVENFEVNVSIVVFNTILLDSDSLHSRSGRKWLCFFFFLFNLLRLFFFFDIFGLVFCFASFFVFNNFFDSLCLCLFCTSSLLRRTFCSSCLSIFHDCRFLFFNTAEEGYLLATFESRLLGSRAHPKKG